MWTGSASRIAYRLAAICLLLGAIFVIRPVLALEKVVRIESAPGEADVYLLQGTRETHVGRTPFDYKAEFHSEMSILRLAFKKPGYETKRVELSASQSELRAALDSRSLVAAPAASQDAALGAIQSQVRPALEPILARFLASSDAPRFELARPASVAGRSGAARLEIALDMQKPAGEQRKPSAQEAEASAREIWRAVAERLAVPVSRQVVTDEPRLSGLMVEVRYTDAQARFTVGTRTETRMESRCQPGMVSVPVFNPCLRMETPYGTTSGPATRCVGGMETRQQHNPCATRIMVPVTESKLDPKMQVEPGTLTFRFYLPREVAGGSTSTAGLYEKAAVLVRSGSNEVLLSRGAIPN